MRLRTSQGILAAAALAAAAFWTSAFGGQTARQTPTTISAPEPRKQELEAPVCSPTDAPSSLGSAAPVRADASLARSGETQLPSGALYIPSSFASADGAYDLYIHFHGAPLVVVESAERANLSAVVVVMNHGVGSSFYSEAYRDPRTYPELLRKIQESVANRSLTSAKLRRVALGSWSAGFAAIAPILDQSKERMPDAVLLVDGLHAELADASHRALNPARLAPFLAAAKRAADGALLFEVTHSAVLPEDFASSTETASYLLRGAGAEPESPARDHEGDPPHLEMVSARGYLARARDTRLTASTEATKGSFVVKGFAGGSPEDHLAQFLQMGATVLPGLAERWAKPSL